MANAVSLCRAIALTACALTLAGLAAPAFPAGPATAPALPRETALSAFIDGVVRDAMTAEHVAGVAVAVVHRDRVVVLRGYGIARHDPDTRVDPQRTLFRVGSITKTLTWIEVMKAVESGAVALDADVNRYLPADLRIPAQRFRQPVTLRHLMSHSAGFADSELGHLIIDRADRLMPFRQYLARRRPPRVREPGQTSSYSNYGAALAGYIVARRAGLTYPALIERDLAAPLGAGGLTMREPYPPRPGLDAPLNPAMASRLAQGFVWTGTGYTAQPTELLANSAPSGSASMSARFAADYMRLLLRDGAIDGRRLYGPLAAMAFRTPIMATVPGTNGWAHGFSMSMLPDGSVGFGHGGATVYAQSSLVVIPALDLGIFVTTNTASGAALARRLPRLVVAWLSGRADRPEMARSGSPALVARAADFAGAYRSTRRPYAGLEAFVDALDGPAHIAVSGDGHLITRNGPLTQSWVPAGPPGEFVATSGNERLRFDLDRHGRAIGMPFPTGTGYLERSSWLYERATFDRLGWATLLGALAAVIGMVALRGASATKRQHRAQWILLAAATCWLTAGAAFIDWLPATESPRLMFDFPGGLLPVTSALAALAAAGSVAALLTLPMVWWPAAADGWPLWRRATHSAAALVFVAFAALLFAWHALDPFA